MHTQYETQTIDLSLLMCVCVCVRVCEYVCANGVLWVCMYVSMSFNAN